MPQTHENDKAFARSGSEDKAFWWPDNRCCQYVQKFQLQLLPPG